MNNCYKQKEVIKKLVLLLFFFILPINAQHSEEEIDKFSPKIIPPSPVASSLGNYGNIPVGMSTGSPNVNLDIYTLKENGISIPVSLSYSSNGVRVDATSKQLGIDWDLIVGGVISRQVNSDDDFKVAWSNPDESRLCIPSDLSAIALNARPVQKDIFSYSAPGISGKFILEGNSFRELNVSDNKIEMFFVPNSNGEMVRTFKITSVEGTEYYFGEGSARESSSNVSYCGSSPSPDFSETAYLLTRIKTVQGQEIYFKYISQAFMTSTYQQMGSSTIMGTALPTTASIGAPCQIIERHTTYFIESIEINNKKIAFEYVDLETNFRYQESKQLKKIKIYSGVNTLFKSFEFSYYSILPNTNSEGLNDYTKTDKKRFFLKDVHEYNNLESSSYQKYSFEYYTPENLPPRNSYSTDIYGYYNARYNRNMLYNNLGPLSLFYSVFKNAVAADRSPNADVVGYGMLKSITYPTKGKTELIYEPNSVYIDKTFYPPKKQSSIGVEAATTAKSIDSPVFNIPHNQLVTLYGEAELMYIGTGICTEDLYPTHWNPFSNVSLINKVTGQVVAQLKSDVNSTIDVSVEAGTYFLRVSSIRSCLNIYGSITYEETKPYIRKVNDPVAGVRVSKTLDYNNNGNINIKKYYYGTPSCLNCSTGEFAIANPESVKNLDLFTSTANQRYTMFSNSKIPLNSFDGASLSYGSVIEGFGENFENGGIIHYFKTRSDEPSIAICDEYIRGTPYSNGFLGGTEYETITFRKNGAAYIYLAQEKFIYKHDESYDFAANNYTSRLYMMYTNPSQTMPITDYFYNFNTYQIRSQRHYLSQKTTTTFDLNGLNPITTTTTYNYGAANHFQLTSQTTINSQQEIVENKYYYAKDAEMINQPFRNQLIDKNILQPALKTQTFKSENKLSEQLTLYDNSAATSNLIVPKTIYAAKFPNSLPAVLNIGNLEKKMTFDQYDDKGNVVQYTPESGIPVAIIWGYNKIQPIAKIENASYSEVLSYVSNLQNLSDADNDNCLTSGCKEQVLREALNSMRFSLPQFMISTYTYNPLMGLTSITDPKGISSYYEYDNYNRLKFIKDKDLNVLQKYCYNYKGQQVDCSDNSSSTVILYKSTAKSGSFIKNNCIAGGVPESVPFSLAAGAVTSTISQEEADSLGLAKFNADGQSNANAIGKCTFYSVAKNGSFVKNNCASGGTGSGVTYSQAAGATISYSSQADADALGFSKFNTDGQAYANMNGTCIYYSAARSGSYIKNNCGLGFQSSAATTYTVPAGTFTSNNSQADADNQAQNLVNSNGQNYANTNGSCTAIVFNAEGEQNFDIGRMYIKVTASSPNHNGHIFNIEINYDNPVGVNKYKTLTVTLAPGETSKLANTSIAAKTYAEISF